MKIILAYTVYNARVLGDISTAVFTENFGMTFAKTGHAGVPDLPGRKLINIPANHMHSF
jgi:hypothetical protein